MNAFRWAVVGLSSMLGVGALAEVKLPAIFSDNMVLQKGEKVPVFGWADDGEKVTVKVGDQSAEGAAEGGKWRVVLDTTKLGATGTLEVTVSGKNTLTIKNVLVGEVWVASGQSNMEWSVGSTKDADIEIASANWPRVRMFTVTKAVSAEPVKDVTGKWEMAEPATVGRFSAVGYYFARDLHTMLKVPVGVIHTSWGGTVSEAWTSREALAAGDEEVKVVLDKWDEGAKKFTPEVKAAFEAKVKAWQAAGSPRNSRPNPPGGSVHANAPTALYNGMVAPIVGYGIKGAIWYQGESNAGRAYQYRKLFPALIQDWRGRWGQGDFSFYWVQLANFQKREEQAGDSAWAELREAQTMTEKLPNAGQAVIIDIGESNDIHPANKQDVGRRLARLALKRDYGLKVADAGPVLDSTAMEGDTVRMKFKNAEGGLKFVGDKLSGFAVAGEDKKFAWAGATIDPKDKTMVVLKSPAVAKPVAVRYGWANNPDANLYNKAGLPASPFRTDDWEGTTAGKK